MDRLRLHRPHVRGFEQAGPGREFDVALPQNLHFPRQEPLPAFDAQRVGRHDDTVVDRLGLQIDGDGRIAESLLGVLMQVDVPIGQVLPAVHVVVDQQAFAVREDAVESAVDIQVDQELVQPAPAFVGHEPAVSWLGIAGPHLGDFIGELREAVEFGKQQAEEIFRIGAADRFETPQRPLPEGAGQGAVVREAIFAAIQFAGKRMRVGMRRRRAGGALAHVGKVDRRQQPGVVFEKLRVLHRPAHWLFHHGQRAVRIPGQPPAIGVLQRALAERLNRHVRHHRLGEAHAHQFTHRPPSLASIERSNAELEFIIHQTAKKGRAAYRFARGLPRCRFAITSLSIHPWTRTPQEIRT